MFHEISIEGPAFRLRPIKDDDAAFVVQLRTDPSLNKFLHSTPLDAERQIAWLRDYYNRPNDYYFVIERRSNGVPEGVVSLYDIDPQTAHGEWGRWILKSNSLAAPESSWLIYRCAFEQIHLKSVYCRTVASNEAVVSFHDAVGFTSRTTLRRHFCIDGTPMDAIEHAVDLARWNEIGPDLHRMAEIVARRLSRG